MKIETGWEAKAKGSAKVQIQTHVYKTWYLESIFSFWLLFFFFVPPWPFSGLQTDNTMNYLLIFVFVLIQDRGICSHGFERQRNSMIHLEELKSLRKTKLWQDFDFYTSLYDCGYKRRVASGHTSRPGDSVRTRCHGEIGPQNGGAKWSDTELPAFPHHV